MNAWWEAPEWTLPGSPSAIWTPRLDTMDEAGVAMSVAALAAGGPLSVGPRALVVATG